MTQNYFRPTHNVNMSELSELLASKTEYGEFYLGTVSYKGYTGEFSSPSGKTFLALSPWRATWNSLKASTPIRSLRS